MAGNDPTTASSRAARTWVARPSGAAARRGNFAASASRCKGGLVVVVVVPWSVAESVAADGGASCPEESGSQARHGETSFVRIIARNLGCACRPRAFTTPGEGVVED